MLAVGAASLSNSAGPVMTRVGGEESVMSYLINRWEPENAEFWQKEGQSIARRNLWISIPCLTLAFVIW